MLMENTCNNKDEEHEESVDLPSLHPVIVGSPETSVTFDSDSITSDEFSEQLAVPNQILSPGSAVHIEKSTDVVIGPLTQFHGPVTIYQNINSDKAIEGTKEKTIGKSENIEKQTKASTPENNATKKHQTLSEVLSKTPTQRLLVYSVIVFLTLITVVLGITLSLKIFTQTQEITTEYIKEESVTLPTPTSLKIYDKKDWNGKPPVKVELLALPVEYVLISHTAGSFCKDFSQCSAIVKSIQSYHFSINITDIGHNFLIGGDGSVYVGRGWDVVNFHKNNTIGIGFMGNFVFDELLPEMVSALEALLEIGVKDRKLKSDYKIVCHNQVAATISPGPKVYSKVSQLSHFYKGQVIV